MNGVLNKFKKRNIQANLYHFILVIFVVAVSVCLIMGLFISHFTLKKSIDYFYENSNLPNLWLDVDKITSEDEEFLEENYKYSKRMVFESEFNISKNNYFAKFIISDGKVSTPYIAEGGKSKGCYVSDDFAEKFDVGVGYSYVNVNIEIENETKSVAFLVVGTISMAENILIDENYEIFIDENVFRETVGLYFEKSASEINLEYNQVLITSEIDNEQKNIINNYYENSSSNLLKMVSKDENTSFLAVEKEIKNSKLMICTYPILFIVISILVVVSTISQMINKERYNIGLLKSLGVSNGQIFKNYTSYGVFICTIGTLIGMITSPLIIPNITFETYDKIFNLPRDIVQLNCPIWLIFVILLSAAIIGYFSALFSAINLTKLSPKECMSGNKKIKLKSRKKKNSFGVFGQSFKNIKIHTLRSLMSITSVMGSALLLIFGFSTAKSIEEASEYSQFATTNVFFSIFKGFSIILLILTILILLMQILSERTKEMTILRIHGVSQLKIWISVLIEMIIIAAIGFGLAAIICYSVMLLSLNIFGIATEITINFISFLKSFLLVFLVVFMVSIIALVRVCKLKLAEEIKFSE